MAVIYKDRDRAAEPGGGNNKVQGIVAVDITKEDLQPADGRGNTQELARSGAQPQSDPIALTRGAGLPILYGGNVRLVIAVEIRDGKV